MAKKKDKKVITLKNETVIENLDDFFTIDEEVTEEQIIDETTEKIVPEENDFIKEVTEDVPLNQFDKIDVNKKHDNANIFIQDNIIDNDEIKKSMMFFKELYLNAPHILDSFLVFSMKFRYFLISENIEFNNITPSKVKKFIRFYSNLDTKFITKFLEMEL